MLVTKAVNGANGFWNKSQRERRGSGHNKRDGLTPIKGIRMGTDLKAHSLDQTLETNPRLPGTKE